MAARIPLVTGEVALVDDEDLHLVADLRWSRAGLRGRTLYAVHNKWQKGIMVRHVLMHRLIMQPPPHLVVDHLNGDGLDNRRCNLRICTHAENAQNRWYHRERCPAPKQRAAA